MSPFRLLYVGATAVLHGPVPYEVLDLYARRHGIDGAEWSYFLRGMTAQDEAYRRQVNQKKG